MGGNTKVLDEKLNLLCLGFLRMVFHMPLAFHINLINSKCCIQHTIAGENHKIMWWQYETRSSVYPK